MSIERFGQLLLAAELESPQRLECRAGPAAWFARSAPDKRTVNEDSVALFDLGPERCVLALADGMGGHEHGERASARALQALGRALSGPTELPLADAILAGFDAANRAVLAELPDSGTTLVAAEIDAGRCRIYHAGDSGALVVGGRGRLIRQTIPHSPVGFAVEAGVIEPEDALHHGDLHLVSNVIGSDAMHVGVSSAFDLKPRDVVLLASDGLFDNLRPLEVATLLRRGPLEAKLGRLVAATAQRMAGAEADQPSKPDDLSLLAFRLRT